MSMESVNLLPSLHELPGEAANQPKSGRDFLDDLARTDATFHAADMTTANSFALWGIFGDINVDDNLIEAYEKAYPGQASDQSLHEQWIEIAARGKRSSKGFISGIKGKLAEIQYQDLLEQNGYTNVIIPDDPTQPVWDISAVSPTGDPVLIQVKTGAANNSGEVQDLILENVAIDFAVSSEIYDKIMENSPELANRMVDMGPDFAVVADVNDGLSTLSKNMGIDLPDGVVDIVPYTATIIASARLIYSVIRTEQQFSAADRTTRNKIQVVQTLTLMSRMGVSTVLAMVGGKGGALAGSAIPGPGTLIGSVAGSVAGASVGIYLNRHLQPRMLDLALDITGLTHDDLFYYKNRKRVEALAQSLERAAIALEILGEDSSEFPRLFANAR